MSLPMLLHLDSAVAGGFSVDNTKKYKISVNLLDQNNVHPPGEGMFLFNNGTIMDLTGNMDDARMTGGFAYICLLLPIVRQGNTLIIGPQDGEGQQNAAEISLDFSKDATLRSYPVPSSAQIPVALADPTKISGELFWNASDNSQHEGLNNGQAQAVQLNISAIQESVSIHVFDRNGDIRYVLDKERMTTPDKPGYGGTNVFDLGTGVYVVAFLKYNPNKPHYTFEVGDPRKDGTGTIDEIP